MRQFFLLLLLIALVPYIGLSKNAPVDVMPLPQSVKIDQGQYRLEQSFKIAINGGGERLSKATTHFLRGLDHRTGLWFSQQFVRQATADAAFPMQVNVQRTGTLEVGEDESYKLEITPSKVILTAPTDLGAMHGLTTLSQLVKSDANGYYFQAMTVEDAPRFVWRGLMIDAARHFMPMDVIKRNIDGMAFVKMNVMHFHLSDNQAWRIESKKFPQLTEKASDGEFYTQQQIKEIIQYAADRGIRVMPEFDVPGHATAILEAFPSLGSDQNAIAYQREVNAGIFDPTLDPTNKATYKFLNTLFTEMAALFPDPYFHIGGDENEGHHWTHNPSIQAFMAKNNIKDNHALQAYFNLKVEKILQKNNKKMMGWEEIQNPEIPTTAVIHSWRGENEGKGPGESLVTAVQAGYPTVLSNGFYLDLLFSAEDHYNTYVMPKQLTSQKEKDLILGGEATMWSELVTATTQESRVWPRTAAVAERLWSAADVRDVRDMYRRLDIVSHQLEIEGLQHIKSREGIIRLLANGQETNALHTLVRVSEPMKGYTRNPMGTMYNSYFSFQKFADACAADAPDALKFKFLVQDFKAGKLDKLQDIKDMLQLWQANDAKLQQVIAHSPMLKEVSGLSAQLSEVATIGLQGIDPEFERSADWLNQAAKTLHHARQQGGRCELQVINPIAQLIGLSEQQISEVAD